MSNNTTAPDALAGEREAVENLMQGVRSYRDQHGAGVAPSDILASLTRRAAALHDLASVAGDADAVRLADDAHLLAGLDRPVIAADNGDLEGMTKDCWRALERYNEPARLFHSTACPFASSATTTARPWCACSPWTACASSLPGRRRGCAARSRRRLGRGWTACAASWRRRSRSCPS